MFFFFLGGGSVPFGEIVEEEELGQRLCTFRDFADVFHLAHDRCFSEKLKPCWLSPSA